MMHEKKAIRSYETTIQTIIAAGCPLSGWAGALKILDNIGVVSTKDSFSDRREESVSSEGIVLPTLDISFLSASRSITDDNNISKVNSSPSLWDDNQLPENILESCQERIPDAFFLLFFVRPETSIIYALHKGYAPEQSLQRWISAHHYILKFIRRNRKRTLLFNTEAVGNSPRQFVDVLEQQNIVPKFNEELSPQSFDFSPDELSLARFMVYEDQEIQAILSELVASAQPLAEPDFHQNTLKAKSQIILRLHNERTLQEEKVELNRQLEESNQKIQLLNEEAASLRQLAKKNEERLKESHKEITEENELLLLQLQQVQEELEEIFLQKLQLEQHQDAKNTSMGEKNHQKNNTTTHVERLKNSPNNGSTSRFKGIARFFHSMSKKQRLLQSQINRVKASGCFDEDWYLAQYPDVAQAGMNPIKHYILYGASEGRNPSPSFNTIQYMSTNSIAGDSDTNPLIHYLKNKKSL